MRKELLDRQGNLRDPETPSKLLLHSYGCYGLPLTVGFDTGNWSLLERDWIIAYAHIRGGPELGKQNWHRKYTKLSKHVTPEDILSCVDFLCKTGLTDPSLVCATSDSAGAGMLASAVNLNPSTFQGIHLSVPFLAIKASLMNSNQPLSKSDYIEFGDPSEGREYIEAISRLCPFTNLQQNQEYPATLITAFVDDYRTPLWNVLMYTNKYRDMVADPKQTKAFGPNSKNIAVILDHGSHLGTNDTESNESRKAIICSFYELVTGKFNKRSPPRVYSSHTGTEGIKSLKSAFTKMFSNK
jgi:protease II